MPSLSIVPIEGLPGFTAGDDLVAALLEACDRQALVLADGDVVVVTQKVVSKVEDRLVWLEAVTPSPFAVAQAAAFAKDPRVLELVLLESRRIVRMDRGVLITETHHGFVCANSGVDLSNIADGYAALLPVDPDASARRLRDSIRARRGVAPAVIITDTFGRPWRDGLTDVAIGVAGLEPLDSFKGAVDEYGHELQMTVVSVADELAGAAELAMGKLSRVPMAVIRGYPYRPSETGRATDHVRSAGMDLFR